MTKRSHIWLALAVLISLVLGYVAVYAYEVKNPVAGLADEYAVLGLLTSIATLLLAVVAGIIVLVAYASATAVPELQAEFTPLDRPTATATRTVNSSEGAAFIELQPEETSTSNRFQVVLRNVSKTSAHNPAIRLTFVGILGYGSGPEWRGMELESGFSSVLQWDGGADLAIHGEWSRTLPWIKFVRTYPPTRSTSNSPTRPYLVVDLVADGFHHEAKILVCDAGHAVT